MTKAKEWIRGRSLYIEQHLTKLEKYLENQQGEGINKLHYKDLLLRVKKIREKFETGK